MTEKLDSIVEDYRHNEGNIVSILQQLQDEFNYIPQEAVQYISRSLEIPVSKFYGVATFYAQFHLKPRGKNIFTLCCGTACHVKGSEKLIARLQQETGLTSSDNTTTDGLITIEKVACVGACSIAPVAIVNKKVHGKAQINQLLKMVKVMREDKSE
ncbi:MAG: NAD(P)H-dependent oxidoreductase subunit E [Candidatus Magnetobacterium sp. LHC-1]|nr:NAD(P)H-dependent oxidoreductase subunit E [Nitrospirota bacterium]MBF0607599.1 NAD(P)H-dependent oxidoreductase subunit E [Nitrospirota bacterium]